MFWIQHELNFPELIDFLPLRFKTWEKKRKEKQANSKIFHFFGTPYVQHLSRDLKNQILTILKQILIPDTQTFRINFRFGEET